MKNKVVDWDFLCPKENISFIFHGGKNSESKIFIDEYFECYECEKITECYEKAKIDIIEILKSGKGGKIYEY